MEVLTHKNRQNFISGPSPPEIRFNASSIETPMDIIESVRLMSSDKQVHARECLRLLN